MIIFVFVGSKRDTHAQVEEWPEVRVKIEVWSYTKLFGKRRLPLVTYVFGDFDRLSAWELEVAARIFRKLRSGGATVLNDPGQALQRYAMLRRLKAAGKNSFQVWLLETDGLPDRYPVFLRTASAHRGAMSGLLKTPEAVRERLDRMIEWGIPSKEILAVEFAAEPIGEIYRKYAAHRVGDSIVSSLSVHSRKWQAKRGTSGVAGEELYAEELEMIKENRFGPELREIFDLARIEYGRVDFGLVRGRIETYEINTNPTMREIEPHPSAHRHASDIFWRESYGRALFRINSVRDGFVELDDPVFKRQRRKDIALPDDRFVR